MKLGSAAPPDLNLHVIPAQAGIYARLSGCGGSCFRAQAAIALSSVAVEPVDGGVDRPASA